MRRADSSRQRIEVTGRRVQLNEWHRPDREGRKELVRRRPAQAPSQGEDAKAGQADRDERADIDQDVAAEEQQLDGHDELVQVRQVLTLTARRT